MECIMFIGDAWLDEQSFAEILHSRRLSLERETLPSESHSQFRRGMCDKGDVYALNIYL